MLSDKFQHKWWEKREDKCSIQHKMTVTLFILLLLYLVSSAIVYALLSTWKGAIGIVLAVAIVVLLAVFLAKNTSRILSVKFVDQVDRITGTAKAIANSRDLSRRIQTYSRPDELSHLEASLNDMLEKLEEAFEMQKRFTADASHELRTPIAVLNGYLDILKQWGKNDPALVEEAIESMKDETLNMKKLSENLLLLSRLELDQHSLVQQVIDLNSILNKLAKDSGVIAGSRSIEYQNNASVEIEGDYSLLLQMFRAVIENSIKYTAEDREIAIRLWQDQGKAVIEVSDDGIGIPDKDLDRIFDRFYRVDKNRDRAKGGTGLGLSLVKYIAELHEGTVEADSVFGKGTTIRFYFPLAKAQ